MANLGICLFLFGVQLVMLSNGEDYDEPYRLQVHYSVPEGWTNDPNGLVFKDGIFHLYFQNTPNQTTPGTISWGHAESPDMVHWVNKPIAIPAFGGNSIFSGCCVLDEHNSTGFATDSSKVPIVAMYTLQANQQEQALAYSNDNGLSFKQYQGNPVIKNPDLTNFRDPNIFKRNGTDFMVLAAGDRLKFYKTNNLLSWEYLSDFGVNPQEGNKSGVWECPSVVTLKDDDGNEHDVVIISMNDGKSRLNITEYMTGQWNGTHFNTYNPNLVQWFDFGYDNYAAIPFNNNPSNGIVMVGWMSNWLYGDKIPTEKWRGQYTVAHNLSLSNINGILHMKHRVIDEFYKLVNPSRTWSMSSPKELKGQQTINITSERSFKTDSMFILDYTIDITNATSGKVGLKVGNQKGEFVTFFYNITNRAYEFRRDKSGDVSFSPAFADTDANVNRISVSNLLSGQMIFDKSSVEIFADDGLTTLSCLIFPSESYEIVEVISAATDDDSSVIVKNLSIRGLNSIWKKKSTDSI